VIGRLAIVVTALLVTACAPVASNTSSSPSAAASPPSSAPATTPASAAPDVTFAPPAALTVFGAASLREALDVMVVKYEAGHPGTSIVLSTDSSAVLRAQIEQGGPADLFLSADVTNPTKLVDAGLTDGGAVDFAGNLLTVVVPTANPGKISTPADLARPGVKIIAAGEDVPITKYANQAVGLLAKAPGYPQDFAAGYASNVVSREDNVKAVMAKIELGEGDAAFVYVTDAKASTKVTTIDLPTEGNIPATYAGVVVKASKHLAAAHQFLDWMNGAEAQAILAQLGFTPPQT
jgi:molybdate transport system substrate-binding protein